jgi:uncharacterized membrane protein YqiK
MRGFLTPQIGVIIAVSAVILGLFAALKFQGARLDSVKANYEACQIRYSETLAMISRQNEAVKTLEKDAQERARKSAAALAKARKEQGSLEAEISRLKGSKPADCSAAVSIVREGLKP